MGTHERIPDAQHVDEGLGVVVVLGMVGESVLDKRDGVINLALNRTGRQKTLYGLIAQEPLESEQVGERRSLVAVPHKAERLM